MKSAYEQISKVTDEIGDTVVPIHVSMICRLLDRMIAAEEKQGIINDVIEQSGDFNEWTEAAIRTIWDAPWLDTTTPGEPMRFYRARKSE